MSKTYEVATVRRGDPSNSHSVVCDLVGPDRRVLDVGCATGYVARSLAEAGCTVSGVDNDATALDKARDVLDRAVLSDLETVDLVAEFGAGSFDVVVFADVLEHLRTPATLLRQARTLLAPGGYLVISVPNVAHGDVRLALAGGRWDYRPLGLLDDTHIRFFTRGTFGELLVRSGFVAVETRTVRVPLFGTELGLRETDLAPELVALVRADPSHVDYQYVLKAVPDDAAGSVAALVAVHDDLVHRLADTEARLLETATALSATRAELATTGQERHRAAMLEQDRSRELAALRATRTFRWTAAARALYGAARGAGR